MGPCPEYIPPDPTTRWIFIGVVFIFMIVGGLGSISVCMSGFQTRTLAAPTAMSEAGSFVSQPQQPVFAAQQQPMTPEQQAQQAYFQQQQQIQLQQLTPQQRLQLQQMSPQQRQQFLRA